jgi:hypothetical protein
LIPRRMNPAATGSEAAKTTACNMSSPFSATTDSGIPWRGDNESGVDYTGPRKSWGYWQGLRDAAVA